MEGPLTPVKRSKQVSFSPIRTPGKSPKKQLDETVNDDELEKQERRMMEDARRRRSSFHISAKALSPLKEVSAPSRRKSMAIRKMEPSALQDLFKNCIKLSTENKINIKNSWQLNLIDYIDEVIENTGDQSNFQVASSTLDASMKIFSCRVDSVHSETFKVLGGLNRADGQPDEDDEDEMMEEKLNDSEKPVKEKKEPKKKKPAGSTIESNVNNLNLKKFEMEYQIQPLCHNSMKDFDVGSAKSLLLNNLMISERFEMILDQEQFHIFEPLREEVFERIEVDDFLMQPARRLSSRLSLQKIERELRQLEEPFAPSPIIQKVMSPKQMMEDDVGPTLYDADFGVGEDSDNEFQSVLATNTSVVQSPRQEKPINVVEHLLQQEAEGDAILDFTNAYSYVKMDSKIAKKNWTGLSHWKVTKKPTEKKKRVDKTLIKDFIDFEDPQCDFIANFEVSRDPNAHTMASSTLTKNSTSTNLLPDDAHYQLEELLRPFNLVKQQVTYLKKSSKTFDMHEDCDESVDFGATPSNEFGGSDDHKMEESDPLDVLIDVTNVVPVKLIEQPKLAQKLNINYAKTSSQVDVKALKENIWNDLKVTKPYERKEFSHLFLETQEQTPSTIPFTFLCLLHIANEQGLEITGRDDLSDLAIKLKQ